MPSSSLMIVVVATAAALVLAQPEHAKNQTRRQTARKKEINSRETHTRQSGRDGNETDSCSQELKPKQKLVLNEPNRTHKSIYFVQTNMLPSTMVVSLPLLTGFLLFPSCCEANCNLPSSIYHPTDTQLDDSKLNPNQPAKDQLRLVFSNSISQTLPHIRVPPQPHSPLFAAFE